MHITLSPIRMDAELVVAREGAALILNGEAVDLAGYDAAAAPNPWIVGQPEKVAGTWQVTLLLPHGPIPWPVPEEAAAVTHPDLIAIGEDGPLLLPGVAE